MVQEKCTTQHALAVDSLARFRSSQRKAGQYIAETASRSKKRSNRFIDFLLFFFMCQKPPLAHYSLKLVARGRFLSTLKNHPFLSYPITPPALAGGF